MATLNLTDEQVRARGLAALNRERGPAGVIRFLRQFELGHGDYSTERHDWLESASLDHLLEDLRNAGRERQ